MKAGFSVICASLKPQPRLNMSKENKIVTIVCCFYVCVSYVSFNFFLQYGEQVHLFPHIINQYVRRIEKSCGGCFFFNKLGV